MALLRNAARIASSGLKAATPQASLAKQPTCIRLGSFAAASRGFASRSLPRLGHNLEDHYDFAEFMCKMHSPLGEYLIWAVIFSTFIVTFGPLLHSNYYFTGRFLPKDQGNTQLCDDSW
eukprot:TRINITY_DN4299_c0_g2_i1.p2 TRINITY_DN4299_c0_g2~~TRINITY_DN4299_c0_g2_i1.p2  ORF type:complete len:119 (-),score=27.76 TRINITY_DN4299_c0_g2_i1:101-457(-)